MLRYSFQGLLFLSLLTACDGDILCSSAPQLVIEGHISQEGFPVVRVTKSMSVEEVYQNYHSVERKCLVREADVSILADGQTYHLIGETDSTSLIPYYYTTHELMGTTGKGYQLNVSYQDWCISSTVTIPTALSIDSVSIVPSTQSEALLLRVLLVNKSTEPIYGRFFLRTSSFRYSDYLLVPDAGFDSEKYPSDSVWINLTRPQVQYKDNVSGFMPGEIIDIQFCTMDKTQYLWWEDYESRLSLSRNPLFPLSNSFNNDGVLGYWAGYGISSKQIQIPYYK